MSKHTPGPWRRSGRGVIAAKRMICVQSVADDECNANAVLIAAAPEMLAALKTLLAEIDAQGDSGDAANRRLIAETIAKAEGRG